MELEVGMYVRTKYGSIEKIVDKYEAPYGFKVVIDEKFKIKHYEHNYIKHIKKASHNIKELIEDDDLIKFKIYGELFICKVYNKSLINYDGEVFDLEELDIVSILTKEQYESMSYKVGE